MKCDFCEILKNNDYELFKDETITVLMDYDPISKGHILILPNDHYKDIDEILETILLHIFNFAKLYVKVLKKRFNPPGYSMMQNGGIYNDIDHFHLHVFPRYNKEDFGWTYAEEVDEEAKNYTKLKRILKQDLEIELNKTK